MSRRTRSQGTAKIYLWHLTKFCEWANKTPDSLIEDRRKASAGSGASDRKHEELLTSYFDYLESKKKFARNTSLVAHAAIRSFYRANYAPLDTYTPESWPTKYERIPSRSELAKTLASSCSALQKALILFSVQSGQRIGIIRSLRFGMVRNSLDAKGPSLISIPAALKDAKGIPVNKRRQPYDFFIGEEAKAALREYLATRGRLNDADFVFVSPRRYRNRPVPLDDEEANRLIRKAFLEAGACSRDEVKGIHHHVLRKFYQTSMEQAGVASTWYEQMMGHVLPRTQKAYSKPSIEQLREAYAKGEPYLSFNVGKAAADVFDIKRDRVSELIVANDTKNIADERAADYGKDPEAEGVDHAERKSKRRVLSKIVSESELASYLEDGWEFVHQLSDHRIVLKKSSQ
ncbi:MAG: tyrosine-type recombinase/integrase [Thermoprotei archaeon]